MKPGNVKTSHWIAYNTLFFIEHFLGENAYQKLLGGVESRLFKKIDAYAAAHPFKSDFRIIEHQKEEHKQPYVHPHYPIIFRGAASDWPCSKKWSFDYFAEQYGDEEVTLINNPGLVKDSDQNYDVVKFRDYIPRLRKGSKEYLKFSRIVDEKSILRKDFDYEWLKKFRVPGALNDLFYFFMGGKNTMTPIHDGFAITVFVQIEGTKRWIFYPTNNRIFIGARPRRFNYFFSKADPNNLNDPAFPLMKHAEPHEILLHPGDVMYFPSLVWHQVENTTDSIGVAFKFASIKYGFLSSKMLATCFFLATKPFLIETLLPFRPDTYNYKKSDLKKIQKKETI